MIPEGYYAFQGGISWQVLSDEHQTTLSFIRDGEVITELTMDRRAAMALARDLIVGRTN